MLSSFLTRKSSKRMVGFLCGWMLVSALSGCFKGKGSWETTYPVAGVVTLKGLPVANADIAFFPVEDSAPGTVRPKAKSGEDGKFVVSTYGQGDGVPVGSYKITVVRHEVDVSRDTIVAKPNDLPRKYSILDTTDLEAEIVAGPNDILLELRQ